MIKLIQQLPSLVRKLELVWSSGASWHLFAVWLINDAARMVPPGAPGWCPGCTEFVFIALSNWLCSPGSFGECLSSSSSVASDESDGDAGLLSVLLGPPTFGPAQHTSESSDLSYYSAIDSSAWPTQIGSPRPVPRWRLARRACSCWKCHHLTSQVSGMDAPFAVLLTDHRIMISPLESMGCHCTTPGFWSGSALRSRLVYWIRVLVCGSTHCSGSRPLTQPANFTETCALWQQTWTFWTSMRCAFRAQRPRLWN